MEKQRVTVIAPRRVANGFDELPHIRDEVNAVARYQDATIFEDVDSVGFLKTALDAKTPHIYHLAGHLTDDGFVANDEIVSMQMVIMTITTAQPRLLVMPICQSRELAERIASRTGIDCIYTIRDVEDDSAAGWSILFYSTLTRNDITSYKQAFDAIDNDSTFFYVEGAKQSRKRSKKQMDEFTDFKNELREITRQLAETNKILYEYQASTRTEIAIIKERIELQKISPPATNGQQTITMEALNRFGMMLILIVVGSIVVATLLPSIIQRLFG